MRSSIEVNPAIIRALGPELSQLVQQFTRISLELLKPTEFDKVLFGHGDTGTMTMQSDLNLSRELLAAVPGAPGSFSEEHDPVGRNGAIRLEHKRIWVFDPVDGSGDRKKGNECGEISAKGYTTLAAFVDGENIEVGVCIRPAHKRVLVFFNQAIHSFGIEDDGKLRTGRFQRTRAAPPGEIRVNLRPAYPDTNFPKEFWDFLNDRVEGFKFVPTPAGGAGDAFSRLLLGDLDMVYSGKKTDWKYWDTAPFDPMLGVLNGKITDFLGSPLLGVKREDLWHSSGVLASAGTNLAHQAFVEGLAAWCSSGEMLYYDPRTKK